MAQEEVAALVERSRSTLEILRLEINPRFRGLLSAICQDAADSENPDPKSFPGIRSLTLTPDGWTVILPASLPLPHFPSLQFLHLTPSLVTDDNAFRVDSFYEELQQSSVCLKGIAAPATQSLIHYLKSYQGGLQELEIHSGGQFKQSPSNYNAALAEELFNNAILMHASSLRRLTINAQYDNGWAFGNSNDTILLDPLPVLGFLKIAVFVDNNPPEDSDYIVSKIGSHSPALISCLIENPTG
jgi:hypothetical protein